MRVKSSRFWLMIFLTIGFLLRLAISLSSDPLTAISGSGDEFYYLVNGAGLFMPEPTGVAHGYPYAVNNLPVAPLYLVLSGLFQQFFSLEMTVIALRITQSILSILICYLAYDLAKMLTDDERVGLVVAFALAFSISFIIEPGKILTETLYIALLVAGVWFYCKTIVCNREQVSWYAPLLVGIFLGLATLTRAVGILFPAGIAGHVIIVSGKSRWKKGLAIGLVILLSYSLTISTWTIYNRTQFDRFVIVSNQFFPTLWRAASEEDGSPEENDELLGEQTAMEQSTAIIASDPGGFIERRLRELAYSYLQPHGTLSFGRESLKTLALDWVNSGFSPGELWRLLTGEGFLVKLLIYIWHYLALIGGIIGMWLTRKQWRISLVLIGFIAYTTLIHFVVLALPRYIYPTYPFFWIFSAVALVALWDSLRGKNKGADLSPPR